MYNNTSVTDARVNTDLNRIPISRVGRRYLLVLISIIVSRCVLFSNENELCANYFASLFVVCHPGKDLVFCFNPLVYFCTCVSTKLFIMRFAQTNLGFQLYLNFFHAPRVRLISKRPSERSSPLSALFLLCTTSRVGFQQVEIQP